MTYKYEFVREQVFDIFRIECEKLGEDNWELVSAFGGKHGFYLAVFKKYVAP